MESAFGVEHTIAKSFVNGKFVRAAELSGKQAAKVRSGGQWKTARGVSETDQAFRQSITSPETKDWAKKAKGVKVNRDAFPMKHMGGAATIRLGGAKSGQSYVSGAAGGKKAAEYLHAHESQHALPQRSSYRLHGQIAGSPDKLMREEARADWHSTGHYGDTKSDSAYAMGARARAGKPDDQYKFSSGDKKELRAAGLKPKNVKYPNRSAMGRATNTVNGALPHYNLKPKNFDAYKNLQDDFKARGVPQRAQSFKGN